MLPDLAVLGQVTHKASFSRGYAQWFWGSDQNIKTPRKKKSSNP